MDDGGPDLALDVVADDRHPALLEALGPVLVRGDEHRDAVDEGAAGLQRLGGVELGRLLRSDRQVGDQHVGLGLAQPLGDVHRRDLGLFDPVLQVLAEAVQRRAALHLHACPVGLGEHVGVVGLEQDRFGDVAAHLAGVDVEGRGDLDIRDVVAAEFDVHQAGRRFVGGGFGVVAEPLHQRGGAIADPHDPDAYFLAGHVIP